MVVGFDTGRLATGLSSSVLVGRAAGCISTNSSVNVFVGQNAGRGVAGCTATENVASRI